MEMARELLADDPEFVEELEERLFNRQLVRSLAMLRANAGLSQKELADVLGCGQPKISKIESGVDADVRFGDYLGYLAATKTDARTFFLPAGSNLVDQVWAHISMIERLFDRLVNLAEKDDVIANGVANFLKEATLNLIRVSELAAATLPQIPLERHHPIEFESPEWRELGERSTGKRA
jgi:transcriptional regulator with XRE-family HTH domain